MITEANYDDMALQPGEDREFKNQFTEFLQKNMGVKEEKKQLNKEAIITHIVIFAFGCITIYFLLNGNL